MDQLSVQRTDREPLTFEGVLVARLHSDTHQSAAGSRHYELGLYRESSGELIVTIDFMTTCAGERSIFQAERVEQPKDAENVLFAFEPCEFVDRKQMHTLTDEHQRKFQQELFRVYDGAVAGMLVAIAQLPTQQVEPPMLHPMPNLADFDSNRAEAQRADETPESERKQRASFLSIFDRQE